MGKRTREAGTIDMFKDYAPPAAVERFSEESVRAYDLAGRLSKAVARTLDECGTSRADIAKQMSDHLQDEGMSKAMLDNYASQAKGHVISALRLVALVMATGDPRALNTILAEAGLICVPTRYEPLIRRELAKEAMERLQREINTADAAWRAGK